MTGTRQTGWFAYCGGLLPTAGVCCLLRGFTAKGQAIVSNMRSERAINPFTPQFGRRPSVLVGREGLLASVEQSLDIGPASLEFNRLILGGRGSGKTTLLSEIAERAEATGMLVLRVDAATPGLLDRISDAIAGARDRYQEAGLPTENSESKGKALSGMTLGPIGAQWGQMPEPRPTWSMHRNLSELGKWAAGRESTVLLTVDEMHAGERKELRRLAGDMQSITGIGELPVSLIGAGLLEMKYTVLEDRKMTFLHRCHRDQVSLVSRAEAYRCLRQTIEAAGGKATQEALETMSGAADNSLAYKVQCIGYHAWAASGSPEHPIGKGEAEIAITIADEDMQSKVLVPMWHDLSDLDKSYLEVLAELDGEAPVSQIADYLPDVSSRTLADTEYRLSASGHVERSADITVKITGPLTLPAITDMARSSAGYKTPLSAPAMTPNAMNRTRCNAPMPRAKAKCALNRGHKGPHRSRR